VLVAKQLPNLFSDFQIKHLVSAPPIAAPIADAKTNLDSALGRMLSKDESQRLQEIREMVGNFKVFDISAQFLEIYTDKTFRPRIHAELLLLEHFHQHNLEFVENDRYIGCSKPSCYCCDLYMRCHPGNFVRRACHGNLWINWRAPIPPVADDQVARQHTAKMLNEMVKSIRQDALDQLLSKQPRRPRVPDSTTGMSTSIREPRRAFLTAPSPVSKSSTSSDSPDSLD
jgi:OTT_1508-like deaminase